MDTTEEQYTEQTDVLEVDQDPSEYVPPEDLEDDLAERNRVFELDNEDFSLKATDGLTLYAKGCSLVLFYGRGALSKKLLVLWHQTADEFSGVAFLTVNTALRRDIMRRFTDIKLSQNHIFNRFTTRPIPFILVYRESNEPGISYPQAFYDGVLTEDGNVEDSLYDWVTNLACEPTYHGSIGAAGSPSEELTEGDRPVSASSQSIGYAYPDQAVIERVIRSREAEIENLQPAPPKCEPDSGFEEERPGPDEPLRVHHQYSDSDIGFIRF